MPYSSARAPSIRSIQPQDSRHRGCSEIGSGAPAAFFNISKRLIPALLVVGLATRSVAQGQTTTGDDRFGVMSHFAQGWDPNWIPLIEKSGISEVRDELYWREIEPEKDVFRFPARYDRYLGELGKHRISPLIVLSFENPNYDSGQTPYSKEGIDGFARYAVEVLRHCGPQVKAVEVWNEYNGTFNHGPASEHRSSTYLEMLRATYVAIKRERPDVIVVGGATAGVPLPYWEKLMAGGGLDYMDALSVHPYRYGSAPEGIEDEIVDLRHLVLKYHHGRTMPIWVTEIGWYLKPSKAPGDLLIDEKTQAEFLVRAYALLLSADVARTYWYLFRDYEDFTMGLVHDDPQRTRKPAYYAYATLVKQLRDAVFVKREPTPDDFYSILFRRPSGQEVRVVWSLTPWVLAVPERTTVVNLEGDKLEAVRRLSITDSPVFIVGPVHGLPSATAKRGELLADSRSDFGGLSGEKGWSYGAFVGLNTAFAPLATFETTDWKSFWTGDYPSLEISADAQHPSKSGDIPVAAVRRWRSTYQGTVRVVGWFRCGAEGDGVGASILVDGRERFRVLLGGGGSLEKTFDLVEEVHRGSTVDFAVDPGPGTNIDFDATALRAAIRSLP
jgi:hypothetical protein